MRGRFIDVVDDDHHADKVRNLNPSIGDIVGRMACGCPDPPPLTDFRAGARPGGRLSQALVPAAPVGSGLGRAAEAARQGPLQWM